MRRFLILAAIVAAAPLAQAGPNLLVNGNFEAGTGTVYFDGSDSTVADDEPGWLAFLGAGDGSYILISPEASSPFAGTRDLDMGIGPAGGGVQTAVGSRPSVTPSATYAATATTDNYFAPSNSAYFIDWFDGDGTLISSVGGPLTDASALTYEPYSQLFQVTGDAPAGAASAGVRLTAGNAGYGGLAADNFTFSLVPEPSTAILGFATSLGMVAVRRSSKTRRVLCIANS